MGPRTRFDQGAAAELAKLENDDVAGGAWRAHVGPESERTPVWFEAIGWREPLEEQDYFLSRFLDAAKALSPDPSEWWVSRDIETGAVGALIRSGFSAVDNAIQSHRAAKIEIDRRCDAFDAAYDRYLALKAKAGAGGVRVQVGARVGSFGRPDTPVYAHDHDGIDASYDRLMKAYADWRNGQAALEVLEARRAEKHAELRRLNRQDNRLRKKSGLTDTDAALTNAYRAEERALMAIMLARPLDFKQAAQRARYMKGKEGFIHEWWDVENLMAALKHHLGMAGA